MKVTIDELRGLNVEVYINWLIETVEKMHLAYIMIPIRTKELYKTIFNNVMWFMYYEQLKPDNINIGRYDKYKELFSKKVKALEAEIEKLTNDLEQVTGLADIQAVSKVVKNAINNPTESKLPSYLNDEHTPGDAITRETFETYVSLQKEYLENQWEFTTSSLNYQIAQTIDFPSILASINGLEAIFRSHLDYDLDKFKRIQSLNTNATSTALKEATENDFKYIDWIIGASFCRAFFYDIDVVIEFALIAYYSRIANQDMGAETVSNSPLKWIGKASQLGYVMHLLEDNGYIEAPKKRDGEINYSAFARSVAKAFRFEGNNDGYLAKSLNPDSNNMENKNKERFSIPHIKDIS